MVVGTFLKNSIDWATDLSRLVASDAFHDVTIRCRNGRVGANAAFLAAANPWWAKVLSSSACESTVVCMPDEDCASVRKYLRAVCVFNAQYSRASQHKVFRVYPNGALKQLRSFVYPSVALKIINTADGQSVKTKPKITVINLVMRKRGLDREDCGAGGDSRSKRPRTAVAKISPLQFGTEAVKISLTKRKENFTNDQIQAQDIVPKKPGEDCFEMISENITEEPEQIQHQIDDLPSPCPSDVNDPSQSNSEDLNLSIDRAAAVPNDSKLSKVSEYENVDMSDEIKSGSSELQRVLKKMSDCGSLQLLATDKNSVAKVILAESGVAAVHGAIHYFDLISLEKLNHLRLIDCINNLERGPFSKDVRSTHSLFQNVNDLMIDQDELDRVEEEVFSEVKSVQHGTKFSVVQGTPPDPCDGCYTGFTGAADYSNPDKVCGLSDNLNISPGLEEHSVSSYVVVAVTGQTVMAGVEVATVDSEQKLSWYCGHAEDTLAVVLKALHGFSRRDLGFDLKSQCRVIAHHMMELKSDIEKAYRSAMKKGNHVAKCRGCQQDIDCLTMLQKKRQYQHKLTCGVRQEMSVSGALRTDPKLLRQDDVLEESLESEEHQDQAEEIQQTFAPQFVTLGPPRDYLFLITKSHKCFLLLVSGEDNVHMVHGAAHIMTSIFGVDHRRLYMKIKDQDERYKANYFTTQFTDRGKMIHRGKNLTSRSVSTTELDTHVFKKLRAMLDSGQPLEFPEVEVKFCMNKERGSSQLKIGEDLKYYPYNVDCTTVTFKTESSSSMDCDMIRDVADISEPEALFCCSWDSSSAVMAVNQKIKLKTPHYHNVWDRKELDYNGMDTEDFDMGKNEIMSRVDAVSQLLSSYVKSSAGILYAVRDMCPYIQSNREAGFRLLSLQAAATLDTMTETCECGIVWSTLTRVEYRRWLYHNKHIHENEFHEFCCPVPGCNIWKKTETSLVSHINNVHMSEMICEKCGHTTKNIGSHKVHIKTCGKTFTCKICQNEFKSLSSLRGHNLSKHQGQPKAKCQYCNQIVQKRLMKEHIGVMHTPDSEKKFRCGDCHKGFYSRAKLNRHAKSHRQ